MYPPPRESSWIEILHDAASCWIVKCHQWHNVLRADGKRQSIRCFFASINDIVNTVVIGTEFNPGQWDCPKDKAKNEVGIICLDNN